MVEAAKNETKRVDRTAESGGMHNVAPETPFLDPSSPTFITPDTAIEQASATVPASEAAAEKAFPSDETVKQLQKVAPTHKSFTTVRYEREQAEKYGKNAFPDGVYGNRNNAYGVEAKPSKKAEEEFKRGKQAQGDAGGYKEPVTSAGDVAGRAIEEFDRNKRAEAQMEAVTQELTKEREAETKRTAKK